MWAARNWGWLFYVEDYSLPTYIRIVISQYKDPYEPINKNNNFETNLKHPKNLWCQQLHHWSFFSTCCGLVLTLIARGWIWVPPIWALLLTTSWQCWGNKSFADALPDGFCLMNISLIYILHLHKFIYLHIHMVEYLTSTCFRDVSMHPVICWEHRAWDLQCSEQFKAQLEEQFVLWDLFPCLDMSLEKPSVYCKVRFAKNNISISHR